MPGLPGGETGDAWHGLFKSLDGGQTWISTLVPGYPQDTSITGLASPMKTFQAAADPVVRAGTNGMFYYAGLVFNRGANAASGIVVSRFLDNNNNGTLDGVTIDGTLDVGNSINGAWIYVVDGLTLNGTMLAPRGGVGNAEAVQHIAHVMQHARGNFCHAGAVRTCPKLPL